MKFSFSSIARAGLLLLVAALSTFAQTAGQQCQTDQSGRPVFAGVNGVGYACYPNTTTANQVWVQVAPLQSTAFGTLGIGVCHAQYNFALDGGVIGLITPVNNCVIPANSIIYNESITWTTAGTGATNTTSIGTTGTGGGAAILLAATAVASLTGQVQGVILPQTASGWKKLTTAGSVTLTTAVAALTAGVAEIYVFYITSST